MMNLPTEGDALAQASPPLAWLRSVLWDDVPGTEVALNAPVREEQSHGREWLALPSIKSPTLLVPTRGRAGARALLQFNDSMTQVERLKKAGAGIAIQGGLARFLVRDRLATLNRAPDGGRDFVEGELPRLLGVPRVEVAISIGQSLRPNIKPVMQVMAPNGRVLAFAKLAWNDLTTQLVDNEVSTLRGLEDHSVRSFRVPHVLHSGEWNRRRFVLLSPLSHGLRRRWPVNGLPPSIVFQELSRLDPQTRGPLVGGPYWHEVIGRAHEVAGDFGGGHQLEDAISRLAAKVSDVEVIHCMSHGDFAPWNMMHSAGSLNIWDWERASGTRPLGLDVLHFCFEVAYHKDAMDPPAAIDAALNRGRYVLRDLGVSRHAAEAVRDVYVLDRLTRLLEGRQASVPIDDRLASSLLASFIGQSGRTR